MHVEFYRNDEAKVSGWDAVRGKRTRVPGSTMALGRGVISHDLAQYVIEAATGYEHGFWGLLAAGATFKSTGRRRTKPGREVIAAHRAELIASEQLAGLHLTDWQQGRSTSVTAALRPGLRAVSGPSPARASGVRLAVQRGPDRERGECDGGWFRSR